jgi:hypothetical protein
MVHENGRKLYGMCLGIPIERIELLRQRMRMGKSPTEGEGEGA